MEEIYENVPRTKPAGSRPSTNQTGPRSSERRFHGAVVLSLGLLCVFLLAGLIGLGVHYHDSVERSAAELSAIKANLTERLQASDNRISSLTEERDQLNANLTEMTELHNLLEKNHDSVERSAAELSAIKANLTERLQASDNRISSLTEERDQLNANLTEMTELHNLLEKMRCCPQGWRKFSCSCYLLSDKSGSWEEGREHCQAAGADLVVIDSPEEQKFLSSFTNEKTFAWIGMTDRDKEGTWVWIDGTPLSIGYWRPSQPDDGGGETAGKEDCAHIIIEGNESRNWNDLACKTNLKWICEKKV